MLTDVRRTPGAATTVTPPWLTPSEASKCRGHGQARSTTAKPEERRRRMLTTDKAAASGLGMNSPASMAASVTA